jgi:hypothetical protein
VKMRRFIENARAAVPVRREGDTGPIPYDWMDE